jgi:hypothetical protein
MQNLSEAQHQEFINNLQIHRNTMRTGARASNTAAAVDCRGAVAKISNEACIS